MDSNLLLLFDRPKEPIYVPKGEKKIIFDVPAKYLPDKYQSMADRILSRFGTESLSSVPIKQIAIPDLSLVLQLGRNDAFSIFIPFHRQMASRLIEFFLGMQSIEDFMSLGAYCRDRVNCHMFIYALAVAILHRDDTKHLPVPQLTEVFPDKFLDSQVFTRASEEANIVPAGTRTPIEIPRDYTATDVDTEHRVAYWREDVGVNLHHWDWHLVHPFQGPKSIVNKDRRGELFYYMHHQIMARYNTERFCNNLKRVRRLTSFRDPIPEAYFPKLDQSVAGRAYPARSLNMVLSDINRDSDRLKFDLADLERYRDRLLEAAHNRQVRDAQGNVIQLDDVTGIDILGNMVEASILSPDQTYYGDLHNLGHLAIALAHDPDHRFLESFGVMGDSTTAMRDPIFYRWHALIDFIFTEFKNSLPAYSINDLAFPGVILSDIRINSPGGNPNTLNTHWTKSDVDLSRGLDFAPRGSILVRLTHLNHDSFFYNFVVNNTNNTEVIGTARIFIAPKFDEAGCYLNFDDQRMLMIEMDKFTVRLKRGENTISRKSTDSSITIPFEATFRNLDSSDRPNAGDLTNLDAFNFCGCGWPQHMLVSKGTKQGYPMDLFIMISNYQKDKVDQPEPIGCRDGVSFCGLRDRKYPDARAMGYPFDRVARRGVRSLINFVTPNMKVQQITVRFSDIVKEREKSRQSFIRS